MVPATETGKRAVLQLALLLAVSCALSAVLWLFRVLYSHTFVYFFLNWNLLLAWIPLGLAVVMVRLNRRTPRPRLVLLLLLGGWLLFFPNSPYIVSDLMHLAPRSRVPLWYDALMLFSFAWNGLILGFVSLWLVQQMVSGWFGRMAGWLMVGFTLAATGFGIYLGRFQRWNSWDILADPYGLLHAVVKPVLDPLAHPRTIGVTLLFGSFLLVAYLTVTLLPSLLRSERVKG